MGKKKKEFQPFFIKQYQLDNEVTGSAMLVEVDGIKILFDYGMHQDNSTPIEKVYDINREKMRIPIDKLDYVILKESHADHCGLLGILGREDIDFGGLIYTTEPTAELGRLILLDSAFIMQTETQRYNSHVKDGKKKLKPLYTKEDVDRVMSLTRCYGYQKEIWLTPNVKFEFLPNGHILGSSMVYMTYDDGNIIKRLLITSDFYYGDRPRPFTKSIIDKCLKADTIITESTYGGRYHTNENPTDVLEKIIEDYVVGKNKILFMPTFAQSRGTSLYYMLNEIFNRNEIIKKANIPVYFCSSLMDKCHQAYGKKEYEEFLDEQWHGHADIFNGRCGFQALTQFKDVENFAIRGNHRRIVIASSGMVTGGYSQAIAKSFVSNNKVVFLTTGYCGMGSLGSELGNDDVKQVMIDGTLKTKRMKSLGKLPNMSSHADNRGLVDFIKSCNQHILKNVLIVHGDEQERKDLKESLEKELNKKVNIQVFNQYDKFKF